MDFVQSKSMGCRSIADLLLGAGVEWVEGRAEGGVVVECIGIAAEVAGFLGTVI